MPTYEHICQNGHEFEEFQSMVSPPVKICPICGATAERRISGGTGLIFKGSGFYITDYAKKNSSGGAASGKPAESGKSPESSKPADSDKSTNSASTSSSSSATGSDSKS